MPDHRQHRGPHPKDRVLFASPFLPRLQQATSDLSLLLERGYQERSSLKLVGDRYRLVARQRTAVRRSACARSQARRRQARMVNLSALGQRSLLIDGFNLLTTLEVALSGGVVFKGRDGAYRDLAGMHGTWRQVEETQEALLLVGRRLHEARLGSCHWLLERGVSNSGRLKALLLLEANQAGWPWTVELTKDADPLLAASPEVIVTADSAVLDRARSWCNVAGEVLAHDLPQAWVLEF